MPGTTRYSATFDRTYEEEDRVDPSPPPVARRSRSLSWQANSGIDGTRPYTPLGGRPFNQRSSSTDNGPAKGPELIPTRTVGKTAVKAHSNPFQFVKVGTCPLYRKAEDQLKKKEVKQPDVLKEEEEWQSNLDSWKSRRRKMSEDVFRRQEEIRQLEQLEEQANQATQKKTKTFSEMVESRQHRGRALSLCLISSPMELQNWEFESSSHKNGSCSSTFSGESEENSTVNSDDEGVSLKGMLNKSQNDLHNNHRTNGDSHIEKNGSNTHNGDYNKLSDLTTNDLQMKQKEGSYIDSGLESISSHRAGDTPDSGSDFSHDSGSSIDCESPRTGVNVLEEFCTKPSQMSSGQEVTVKLCLNGKGQDFGFTFLGGKNEGQVIIASVLEGSKADSSSIHLGDQIIRIDGQELSSKKHIEIAGMIQKAREKGEVTLLLWRHSKSPENGTTNGFSKSESLPKNAVKPDKSEINSSKAKSLQYEKSIESENEMFVDDFDELQKQSELLCSSDKSESRIQANGNISPPIKVIPNLTLSESSSKSKSVASNSFIEKPVKNAQKVNSEINNESEKKSDVKVQNKTRRKGVYSLNVSTDTIQNSKERTVNSLFPLSPVTELPSPDEARTLASALASNLTSVYDSQKGMLKEADAKSPLIKENNKSPVTANTTASPKNVPFGILKTSPKNETKTDSTVAPSSPSISMNTELNATPGSPQDVKPKLVLKKVKPKTKKNANSQKVSTPAKQTEEFKNVESLNIVFQSEPKNVNSEKLNNVKNSEISCDNAKTSIDLVPDIPPVEKVAEEMEKLILAQLEEEERAKELASGLQIKSPVSSPEHLIIAPPKLAEPPKEKPPPPPSIQEGNQKDTSLKRVNSTKRIKKEICKRRSNFLGIDSAEGSLECSEPSIPPPPALEEILKAEMELDRQSRLQVESASTARLTLEEKEIMQREKEIIESLESEERQKMLLNATQEYSDVSPSTVNDAAEEERIQYLKEERKRLEVERLMSEEQQLQLIEEKQLREREEFIRKQEADKSAVPLSAPSLSVTTNVPNILQPSLSADTQSCVSVSGTLGDGKSLTSNSASGNSSSVPVEMEKVPQKPAVPPKPLKKKEAIRKERERLRQEQETLVREREEHRRKLLQEQEELLKHQKSHALEAPVSRLGPLPPLVQPNFQPQLTSPPARDSASFPSRSCHGAQNGAAGSPDTAELMAPVVARQNRIPPPRKAVQQSDAWGQQKENGTISDKQVSIPNDTTQNGITSSSKLDITNDKTKGEIKSELKANAEINTAKEEICVKVKKVIPKKENGENIIKSIPLPNDVSPNETSETPSSIMLNITNDAMKEQIVTETKSNSDIDSAKKMGVVKVKKVVKKENEDNFTKAVPLPNDATPTKTSTTPSSTMPNITNDTMKEQPIITESKANSEIDNAKKTGVVKVVKKENRDNITKSIPLPNDVSPTKATETPSSTEPNITNDTMKKQTITEPKDNSEIDKKENGDNITKSIPHSNNVSPNKTSETPSSTEPNITNYAIKELSVPEANFEIVSANKMGVVKVKKVVKKENGDNITKSIPLPNDVSPTKTSETPSSAEPNITNDTKKEQTITEPKDNSEIDNAKKIGVVKVVKKENGDNITKSIPLPNDVSPNKTSKTPSFTEPNIANDTIKEQTVLKANSELNNTKKMGILKVNKVAKKGNEDNITKSIPLSNDVSPNEISETPSSINPNITKDAMQEQIVTETKANSDIDSAKKMDVVKVKKVVKKAPSVRKQNQDSLTESRYNQNHWLIQEAEMRRITEFKERQRSCSQTHLAEDDVCSNPPRVPVIPPTHNQHLNFAVQDKMRNYNQPGVPIKKYPPPVVKEQLNTIYPRETISQQPPMKPSRVVPMERKEHMLSVSGRKRCSHCNEELGRGAAMIIESLQLYYHIHCFQCCVCQAQLGNGSCGADVRVRNQKLHCNNCYSNDEAGLKFSQV